jgi:HSF-type DNA-binding
MAVCASSAKKSKRRSSSSKAAPTKEFTCHNIDNDCYPSYRDFGRTSFDCTHKFYASTSQDIIGPEDSSFGRGSSTASGRGGKKSTFPRMLYEMVDDAEEQGYTDVIAWMPHGRSVIVRDKDRFTDEILPKFFGSQNSFASFQRQLNVYGFLRMTKAGPDRKSYYHELFLRGRKDLIALIPRKRKTTARVRRSLDPTTEPNLYLFPPCLEDGRGEGGAPGVAACLEDGRGGGSAPGVAAANFEPFYSNNAVDVPRSVPSSSTTATMIFQGPFHTLSYESLSLVPPAVGQAPPPQQFTFQQSSSAPYVVAQYQAAAEIQPAGIMSHEVDEAEWAQHEELEASSTCSMTTEDEEPEMFVSTTTPYQPYHTAEYNWHSQFIVASAGTQDERYDDAGQQQGRRVTPQQSFNSILPHHHHSNDYQHQEYHDGAGRGVDHIHSSTAVDVANFLWEDEELDRF